MEGCLLCLKNHKDNVGYIQANSAHWLEFNILNIIEKHLWPIERVEPSSFLCKLCWKELYDFHKFFMTIKVAHTTNYEIEMEPYCLQISKQSKVSFIDDDDQVKLEQYDSQILMEQTLSTSTLEKCTSTGLIRDNTNPDVKLEQEVFIYDSPVRTNSFQDNSHTDLSFVESEETDSIVTEINGNIEDQTNEKRSHRKYMQNSPKAEQELEDDILEDKFEHHKIRKNFNHTILSEELANSTNSSETENNNSFNSIQQEDVYEGDDISLKKRKRGRPKNSLNKNWFNSMISRPARKRKLPCKLLTYEVESTNNRKTKKLPKELYLYLKSGKRGRPRKILINSMNSSNISCEETLTTAELTAGQQQQHPQLCDDNIPQKSKGKRGRPRKYFTKDIVGTQEFCSDKPSTSSSGKRGRPRKYFTNDIKSTTEIPKVRGRPRKYFTNDIKSTTKIPKARGRPRKYFTNDIKSTTEIPKEPTVKSENSIPYMDNHARVKSKFKNRKRCRPYKDLMRNYIATSMRCMQLFKSKNATRSESEI